MTEPIVQQLSLFDPLEVPLTKGYIALVDPIDADLLERKWQVNILPNAIYAQRKEWHQSKLRTVSMHRLILARKIGRALLPDEVVDHRDSNGLNNTRSNLRVATRSQNQWNKRTSKTNTSGYKGVCFDAYNNAWKAAIAVKGKIKNLGLFDTPEAAYEAYCAAGRELHGAFFNPGATPQEPTE